METHNYNVDMTWTNDRKGVMCSPELTRGESLSGNCIEVATPPEFPKGMPGIWSPEHLYTAAVSSCLMTTFLAIAENSKLDFVSFRCHAEGKLERIDGKFLMTEILLEPAVVVQDETSREKALKVLAKAEAGCLISNSVKSKVTMLPQVTLQEINSKVHSAGV
jgi:peroxiredoxin-like protein